MSRQFRRFNRNYHDAVLVECTLGPRREAHLTFRLDPVWNDGDAIEHDVHLSAIGNWDEVSPILASLPRAPDGSCGTVIGFKWDRADQIVLELDRGIVIVFDKPKVIEI